MNRDETKDYKKIGLANYNDFILDLYDANPIANLGEGYSKQLKLSESSSGNKKIGSFDLLKESLRLRNTAVLNVKLKEKIFKWEKERFSQLKPYIPPKDKDEGTKTVINIDDDEDPPKLKLPRLPKFKFPLKGPKTAPAPKTAPVTQTAPKTAPVTQTVPKTAPGTQTAPQPGRVPDPQPGRVPDPGSQPQLPRVPTPGQDRQRDKPGSDIPNILPPFPRRIPGFLRGITGFLRGIPNILGPLIPRGRMAFAAQGIGPGNVPVGSNVSPTNNFSFSKNNLRSTQGIFNKALGGGTGSIKTPEVNKDLYKLLTNFTNNPKVRTGIKFGGRATGGALTLYDIFRRKQEGQSNTQIVAGTGSGILGATVGSTVGKATAVAIAKAASPLLVTPVPGARLLYGALVLGGIIGGSYLFSSIADKITGADKMSSSNSEFDNQFLAGNLPYQQQNRNLPGTQRANLSGIQSEMYDYIKSKGLSHNHTLGLLANINRESSFDIDAVGDSGTSFGLFQWHGVRAEAMKKSVSNWKTNWKGQIDYALTEPQNLSDVKPGAYQKETFADAKSAAFWWTKNWERPKDLKSARINQSSYIDNISIRRSTPTGSGTTPTGDRSINFYGGQGRDRSGEPGIDFSFGDYKSNYNLYDGVVVETGKLYGTGYGNVVTIRSIDPTTGKSFDAMYAHFGNGTIQVKPGQTVKSGDYLGPVGWNHERGVPAPGAGNMTGPHTSLDFFEPNESPGQMTSPYSNRQYFIDSILDKKILPGLNSADEQKPPVTPKVPDADFLKNLNFNQDPDFLKPQSNLGSSLNNNVEIGRVLDDENEEILSQEIANAFLSGVTLNSDSNVRIQYIPIPMEGGATIASSNQNTPAWGHTSIIAG